MIRLGLPISEHWETITPTIFPDGTSQVYNLKILPKEINGCIIKWNFESEAEFIHIAQLKTLLDKNHNYGTILELPYLPYARQDKEVSNESTFAKKTFCNLLYSLDFKKIITYDVHSNTGYNIMNSELWENRKAEHIHKVIEASNPDVIFYPDGGALDRYSNMFLGYHRTINMLPKAYGTKVREQSTGNILSYEVINHKSLFDKNVLIVDDLCDGGATFIEAAKKLRLLGANNIDLCVSHGIFSKGRSHLTENGIRNIYTTNSLIKNANGFEV